MLPCLSFPLPPFRYPFILPTHSSALPFQFPSRSYSASVKGTAANSMLFTYAASYSKNKLFSKKERYTHSFRCCCFFLSYDDEAERITQYERIALEDLEKIEIGESFQSQLVPADLLYHQNTKLRNVHTVLPIRK